jgi:hypothetical protein
MTRILLDMGLCFFVLIRSKAADVKKISPAVSWKINSHGKKEMTHDGRIDEGRTLQ